MQLRHNIHALEAVQKSCIGTERKVGNGVSHSHSPSTERITDSPSDSLSSSPHPSRENSACIGVSRGKHFEPTCTPSTANRVLFILLLQVIPASYSHQVICNLVPIHFLLPFSPPSRSLDSVPSLSLPTCCPTSLTLLPTLFLLPHRNS